ncbi:MAG: hypothetical protein GX887_02360, partial [Firmicutes bacterium]|nr:hypothetical protein [Bacillota bacterium]
MIGKYKKIISWGLLLITLAVFSGIGNISFASGAVNIPDEKLEEAIRDRLKKQSGDITVADMKSLPFLDAIGREIYDLTGLE